jgi:hypothetical protein
LRSFRSIFLDLRPDKLYNKTNTKIFWKEAAKMKTLILNFCCLLLFIPAQAMGESARETRNKRLAEIDKYISQQRIDLENYYRGQLVEITQRAQSEIRLLEAADKAIYAGLDEQAEVAKWILHIDSYGYQAPWYLVDNTERTLRLKDDFKGSIKETPKRFAVAHSRIADRKSDILAKLEWEAVKLQQQKQYSLTAGLAQLEKRLKEDALKPQPKVAHGVVAGILYSSDKPAALIDGKIVHEGDAIQGVTVVKIHKDRVEFAKKSRKWEQKVQQPLASYW